MINKFNKEKIKAYLIALLIFLVALFPRVYNLSELSETSDEKKWLIRSSDFINKIIALDFKNSTAEFERHPGIPAAFFMGIFINSLATSNNYEIKNLVKPFSWSLKIMNPLEAARIPMAIIGSLTCVFLFWFVYKIWGIYTATIAGFFLALSPFHISLSRIAHQDAMLTFLFLGTIFFYFFGLKENSLKYRYLAGIFFGLALLTKIIAFSIPIIIIIWKIIIRLKKGERKYLPIDIHDIIIFLVGVLIFFALYPTMWTNPVNNFLEHIKMNLDAGGLDDSYFYLGNVRSGANFYFYYFNSLLRLNEILLAGIIISLAILIKNIIFKKKIKSIYLLLLVWFVVFYIMMSSFGKMKDRYFIVAWPILITIASVSINKIIRYATIKLDIKNIRLFLSATIVFLFSIIGLIIVQPNYYFYYNHLLSKDYLRWTVAIGRGGEGMKQAMEIINMAPGGKKVLSNYDQSETYLKGRYVRFQERFFKKKQSKSVHYIIWRIGNEQKHSPETIYKEYILKLKPLHTIKINGFEVVRIYLNPKKLLKDTGEN